MSAEITTKEDVRNLIPRTRLAESLKVSERTLVRWEKRGFRGERLIPVRIGKGVYYTPKSVEEFRAATRSPGTAPLPVLAELVAPTNGPQDQASPEAN